MLKVFAKRSFYISRVALLMAALMLGTSCFKDLQIDPTTKQSNLPETVESVSPGYTNNPGESGYGNGPGGFRPTDNHPVDSETSSSASLGPTGPDHGATTAPSEPLVRFNGDFDWWSENPFPLHVRYNMPTPERRTVLRFIDLPEIEFHNSSLFDRLRGSWSELSGSLIFTGDLNSAELFIGITPYNNPENGASGASGHRALTASFDFLRKEITSISFTNINNISDFVAIEGWLYEKISGLRMQTIDVMILHLSSLTDKDDLYRMDIAETLEYEEEKKIEYVHAELSYEPAVYFRNPRKELGETNRDDIQGRLQLEHNLLRGRLDISRDIPFQNGTGYGTAEASLIVDFSSGSYYRSDEPYKVEDGVLHWVDYPDAILLELAESMREELFAMIAGNRSTIATETDITVE